MASQAQPKDRGLSAQQAIVVFMIIMGTAFCATVWAGPGFADHALGIEQIMALGIYAQGMGIVGSIARRRWVRYVAAAACSLLGLTVLGEIFVLKNAEFDTLLHASGLWGKNTPPPLYWVMPSTLPALLLTLCGPSLLAVEHRRTSIAAGSLTFVRVALWISGHWLVGYEALNGQVMRIFRATGPLVLQCMTFSIAIGAVLVLLRGDRRWLRSLTAADQSMALARFILPICVAPVAGAFVGGVASRLGWIEVDAVQNLNIETTSVLVAAFTLAALRSAWLERHARESLARVLQISPVIIHNQERRIEYWPQGCVELYGYSAGEALGKHSDELLKTEFPVPREQVLATVVRDGEWAGEVRQTNKRGHALWVATRIVADRDTEANEVRYVETLSDMTALKLTNAALVETSESLKSAMELYDLGMLEYDGASEKMRYSPEFTRMVGLEPDALGDGDYSWRRLLEPEEDDRLMSLLDEDRETRASRRSIDLQIRHSDGAYRTLHGVLRYSYRADGGLARVVGIFVDITEQLKARAEAAARDARLMELQSELAHTTRLSAMGELAAALAHELNQPLTAAGNAASAITMTLKDRDKPMDEVRMQRLLRAARHVESQALRAGEIVHRLREFIARGDAQTKPEKLNVMISDSVALALPDPAMSQIDVRIDVDRGAVNVLASRVQIQQVMVNLVRNAVESMAMQASPRILTVTAEPRGDFALISVADTGPGLDPELANKLFSPFLSTKTEGMGVGLSISRRIVETHGGRLWAEPAREGGGAEFRFTLPLFVIRPEDLEEGAEGADAPLRSVGA